jgi:ABC-2 type transport system permease protein
MTSAMIAGADTAAHRISYPGTGMARLTRIELRKSIDTRAGRWLLITLALVGVAMALLAALTGATTDHTFQNSVSAVEGVISLLLPVLGILLVTSEWSQRTALQTFALVPRRNRIVAAKLLAGSALAVGVAVVGLVLSVLATALTSHPDSGAWHLAIPVALGGIAVQLLSLLTGMAFGLLLLTTAAAIVVNFVVPLAWAVVAGSVHPLHGVQPWLDSTQPSTYLLEGDLTPNHWAQIGVNALVWVVALLAAGLVRLRRQEIA